MDPGREGRVSPLESSLFPMENPREATSDERTELESMNTHTLVAFGGLSCALAVVLGAFGAHLLEDQLSPEDLEIWETAVRYQGAHGLGLILVGALRPQLDPGPWVGRGLLIGILLFSGSLYLLVLLDQRWLGAVTPLGGVSWILAWTLLARRAVVGLRGSTDRP